MKALLFVAFISAAHATKMEETETYFETTSFEDLLKKKHASTRDPASFQPSARVIAVRRGLALHSDFENKMPQDIVLNSGSTEGFSEGMDLSVMRKIPVLNPYKDNQALEIEYAFATIKIIHVQKDLSVARLEKITPPTEGMSSNLYAIVVGDYVGKSTK